MLIRMLFNSKIIPINIRQHILKDVQMIVQEKVFVILSLEFVDVITVLEVQIVVKQLKLNVQMIVMVKDNVLITDVNVIKDFQIHPVVQNSYVEINQEIVLVGQKQVIA